MHLDQFASSSRSAIGSSVVDLKQQIQRVHEQQHDAQKQHETFTFQPLLLSPRAVVFLDHLRPRCSSTPSSTQRQKKCRRRHCFWGRIPSIRISLWTFMYCREPRFIIYVHLPRIRSPSSLFRNCHRLQSAFRSFTSIFVFRRSFCL